MHVHRVFYLGWLSQYSTMGVGIHTKFMVVFVVATHGHPKVMHLHFYYVKIHTFQTSMGSDIGPCCPTYLDIVIT